MDMADEMVDETEDGSETCELVRSIVCSGNVLRNSLFESGRLSRVSSIS